MGEVLNLSHGKPLLMVGEYHGNPGSISFYDLKGYCMLSLHISVLSAPSSYPRHSGATVSIDGGCDLAHTICDMLLLEKTNDVAPLSLGIVGDRMDFKEHGNILFSLRVKSRRLYNGDSDCN
ncbi:MAG: hypothetical protein QCH31_04620 [Methanolobus sp.]|nr:hypothetical protein [Methanolobus sp.]